jgi:hypothetical protein
VRVEAEKNDDIRHSDANVTKLSFYRGEGCNT